MIEPVARARIDAGVRGMLCRAVVADNVATENGFAPDDGSRRQPFTNRALLRSSNNDEMAADG